jgi:hypothetical protein
VRALPNTDPPPGYERAKRYNGTLLLLGGIGFVVGYGVSTASSQLLRQHGAKRFVPVVGPFLLENDVGDCGLRYMAGLMFRASGALLQLGGLLDLGVGVATAKTVYERQEAKASMPQRLAVVPVFGPTCKGLHAQLRF